MSTRTQHDILLIADELAARAAVAGIETHSITTRTRTADIWPHITIHVAGPKTTGQLLELAAELGLQGVDVKHWWGCVKGRLVEDDITVELM